MPAQGALRQRVGERHGARVVRHAQRVAGGPAGLVHDEPLQRLVLRDQLLDPGGEVVAAEGGDLLPAPGPVEALREPLAPPADPGALPLQPGQELGRRPVRGGRSGGSQRGAVGLERLQVRGHHVVADEVAPGRRGRVLLHAPQGLEAGGGGEREEAAQLVEVHGHSDE
ncbi:MAG: hypothetical protein QM767_19675 [Anaeromyxobacter sp.]